MQLTFSQMAKGNVKMKTDVETHTKERNSY